MDTVRTQSQPNMADLFSEAFVNTLLFLAFFGFIALVSSFSDSPPSKPTPVETWHLFAASPLLGLWSAKWQLPYLTNMSVMHLSFLAALVAFVMLWHDHATSSYLLFTAATVFSMKSRHQPKA